MHKTALAAIVAALLAAPAFAADSVTSTVVSVDAKHRTVVLADRSIMAVGKDVNLDAVTTGTKVVLATRVDEDGYAPASAITPAN